MSTATQGRRNSRFGVAAMARTAYLPVGRLVYAAASGLGLVLATQVAPSLHVIGEYIYYVGFASALATLGGLGLDRIMARRISAGEICVGMPGKIVHFRLVLFAAIVLSASATGIALDLAAVLISAGIFVVSRILYADLEAVWIGADLGDKTLFIALVVNGIVTGGGIIFGSFFSVAAVMALSSLGNLLAWLILMSRGRIKKVFATMPGVLKEAQGISWSLLLAIMYARVDLVLLAAIGASLESVAVYGIITRVFDAVALVRGSLAQKAAREVSRLRIRSKARRLYKLAMRTQIIVISVAVIGVLVVLSSVAVDFPIGASPSSVAAAFVALPLFFSHLPTTAMIYSDARTHRLLLGSVMTCAGSIGLKWLLISSMGLDGAVLALGLVELLSALVFFILYWIDAGTWRFAKIVWVPLLFGVVMAVCALLLLET